MEKGMERPAGASAGFGFDSAGGAVPDLAGFGVSTEPTAGNVLSGVGALRSPSCIPLSWFVDGIRSCSTNAAHRPRSRRI
jgi:hypothetical protein